MLSQALFMYVHTCVHIPRKTPPMFTCMETSRHKTLALCCHWLQKGGEVGGSKKKKIPMTLKSFYSCNHRLPLTWIRAVTPAPACLPPRLPKLPAGRQTGKLPNYCQGGQGKERTWRGRLRKTDWKTEIQEEKGTQPPATKSRHRLKPSQLRYAQVHVHTFTIQIHHFGSTSRSQIYKHTDIHGS